MRRVHHFDPNAKKQSMHWKQPGSAIVRNVASISSVGKMMASILWDSQGIIMVHYLEEGCMINGAYYAEELKCLCQWIVKKRRGKLTQGVLL